LFRSATPPFLSIACDGISGAFSYKVCQLNADRKRMDSRCLCVIV